MPASSHAARHRDRERWAGVRRSGITRAWLAGGRPSGQGRGRREAVERAGRSPGANRASAWLSGSLIETAPVTAAPSSVKSPSRAKACSLWPAYIGIGRAGHALTVQWQAFMAGGIAGGARVVQGLARTSRPRLTRRAGLLHTFPWPQRTGLRPRIERRRHAVFGTACAPRRTPIDS
jgi:hypothetical protein